MHTDEYEISLAREINHCQQVVGQINKAVQRRQQHYGMDYEAAVRASGDGRVELSAEVLAQWREDLEALPIWEQRLQEYREALAMMRISAPRG